MVIKTPTQTFSSKLLVRSPFSVYRVKELLEEDDRRISFIGLNDVFVTACFSKKEPSRIDLTVPYAKEWEEDF